MILVIGGTGRIGGEVVRLLQDQGEAFTAMVRSRGKAETLQSQGVETVIGDLADLASLVPVMKGVASLFLLTPGVADQADLQLNAIEAAESAGVGFIVKVSALGADPDSPIKIQRDHAEVEECLTASGVPHTLLRPGSFMQNLLASAGSIREAGEFYGSSGDGKIAMIDSRDIATVATAVLTGEGHAGSIYTLTGPEALSNPEVSGVLSAELGRDVRYVNVPGEAFGRGLLEAGLPEWLVHDLLMLDEAYASGEDDPVTDDVARVTGQPARPFAEFVREHRDVFSS